VCCGVEGLNLLQQTVYIYCSGKRRKQAKWGSAGRVERLTITDSQLYLKRAPQQLLLKGLALGPPKCLLCPSHERVHPNRALLNVTRMKKHRV